MNCIVAGGEKYNSDVIYFFYLRFMPLIEDLTSMSPEVLKIVVICIVIVIFHIALSISLPRDKNNRGDDNSKK